VTILDGRPATTVTGETIEVLAWRSNSWLVRASTADGREFSCLVTRPNSASLLLHDCLPQRRDPVLAELLLAAASHVRSTLGSDDEVYAVHPAAWDEYLRDTGTLALHGMAHLGLLLDDQLLQAHHRPLPDGYRRVPLREVAEDTLVALTGEAGDRAVWREVLTSRYGPVIDEASLAIHDGQTIVAAIAISEHLGKPLIGHCVSSTRHRGRGLGRLVLVDSLRQLAAIGYSDCDLHVLQDNWIAQRLYRSVGFGPLRAPLRVRRIGVGHVQ
jgi:ribosomal protein S18 acetylase RimI-like enzyme